MKAKSQRRTRTAVAGARLGMVVRYMQMHAAGSGVEEVMEELGLRSRQTLHNFRHVIRKYHGFTLPRLAGERGCDIPAEIGQAEARQTDREMSFVLIAG